jgi:hypothetical protein
MNENKPLKDIAKCEHCNRLLECWNALRPSYDGCYVPDDCDLKAEYLVQLWNGCAIVAANE